MISLSDDEMSALIDAARPIPARDLLRDVIAELGKYEVLGVGVIHRVTARLQRQHLAPRSYRNGVNKWNR
jgi:hypothetical protein